MTLDTIEKTASYQLIGVCRAHRNYAGQTLARHGLFPGQEWILLHLRGQQGLPHAELARRCDVEGPTLSKALRRMERVGLVERRPDPADARVSRIYLTEHGTAVCVEIDQIWADLEQTTIAGLTAEEQTVLRRLLSQIRHNFR